MPANLSGISRTSPLQVLFECIDMAQEVESSNYFFSKVEPTLSLLGAAYALFFPGAYHDNLVHYRDHILLGDKGGGLRATIVTRSLGNCYLLLAMISFFLIPTLTENLAPYPVIHENILVTFLLCLAACDLTHIYVVASHLPETVYAYPFTKWSFLVWGNIGITAILFLVRCLWFLGYGRPYYGLGDSERKRMKDKSEQPRFGGSLRPKDRAEYERLKVGNHSSGSWSRQD
ncbi:hypothetical protein [Phaffia rhodozyma]|uniref:DUF7704 domain-containing protein n=1 Tax=Phaffia rhodozyma TaxID=264483 RepID=A0A0F7SSI8_PHARH|nr:hypothetical protein [Phaffia rhodozyma]